MLDVHGVVDSGEDIDRVLKPLLDRLEQVNQEHPKPESEVSRT